MGHNLSVPPLQPCLYCEALFEKPLPSRFLNRPIIRRMWDLVKLENPGLATMPYESKRGMLNNILKSVRPSNPNGIQSLAAIQALYNATFDRELFFRHTDVNVGYSLLVSNGGLTMMEAPTNSSWMARSRSFQGTCSLPSCLSSSQESVNFCTRVPSPS